MPIEFEISNIQMNGYRIPSITAYNRLEVFPRTVNFDRSLKAEVRDAMWMLTRQWQFGEFQAEDAATAISTKILGEHLQMDEVHFPGNKVFAYDKMLPLETIVEREKLSATLSLSIQMARYFIKLIKTKPGFDDYLASLIDRYPLNYNVYENDREGQQLLRIATGKIFDGFIFYENTVSGTVSPDIASVLSAEIILFQNWFRRTYNQPENNINAPWQPSKLEYQFAIASSLEEESGKQKLEAGHYHGGHLDWYSFDMNTPSLTTEPVAVAKENIQSYIPSPVSFKGMPAARFWMMEESRTDFGKIDTSPTGLLHLLLAEFGLTCSNDWFMLPYQLPVNTLCEIKGILVTDVFGENVLIRPAGTGAESNWQRWAMFHHTELNKKVKSNTNRFYLVPAITKSQEADPVEKIKFLRDEMANMVWAVESIVPSQAGMGVNGDEMALKETDAVVVPTGTGPTVTDPDKPKIRYILGTTVPDNWIPFIPVHKGSSDKETVLQRAAMPGAPGALGKIVSEQAAPYYIEDGIVLRSGLEASRSFQMTRWQNGTSALWMGRRKENSTGEGSGKLMFDQLEDIP